MTWNELVRQAPGLASFERAAVQAGENDWRDWPQFIRSFREFVSLFPGLPPGAKARALEYLSDVHSGALRGR